MPDVDLFERVDLLRLRIVDIKGPSGRVFTVRCSQCGKRGYHLASCTRAKLAPRTPAYAQRGLLLSSTYFDIGLACAYVLQLELAARRGEP